MRNITIILDPAHGIDVAGKRSPDGVHREYLWSRERVKSLRTILTSMGYEVYVTTESDKEPGLSVRKNFATNLKTKNKKLLISLHNNASGNGETWKDAKGIEVYTTKGVTDSDICADFFIQRFTKDFPELKIRLNKDAYLERDKESNFTVLMGSGYMAVLIEWLFQDNKSDYEGLLNSDLNKKFEDSIVSAIEEINAYFEKNL